MESNVDRWSPSGVISVSELNRRVRLAIESEVPLMWVRGEISNLKRYDSGHWYFSLKDTNSQVDCVMFRQKAQYLDWRAENGMQVEVRALASLYEPRGKYQLSVENMRRAGLGALYEAFEKLKAKLQADGLFDPQQKRALPRFARGVAVVSSAQGAALRDVLTTLKRRMPTLPVVIYPTPVQGEGAAQKIALAIDTASLRAQRDGGDVLILCRGGGSIEDLWSFNEEIIARSIYECAIPVVTGVGHETDFTIADFVADLRAATPTAAAESVSADVVQLREQWLQWCGRLARAWVHRFEEAMQKLDYLSRRLTHPRERVLERLQDLEQWTLRLKVAWRHEQQRFGWKTQSLAQRLKGAGVDWRHFEQQLNQTARYFRDSMSRQLESKQAQLSYIQTHLNALNPQRTLERGYSVVTTSNGQIVRQAQSLMHGEPVSIRFAEGAVEAKIHTVLPENR